MSNLFERLEADRQSVELVETVPEDPAFAGHHTVPWIDKSLFNNAHVPLELKQNSRRIDEKCPTAKSFKTQVATERNLKPSRESYVLQFSGSSRNCKPRQNLTEFLRCSKVS